VFCASFVVQSSTGTSYTLHSTLHTPHSTLYTLYTPHSTLYTPHSLLYTPHSTLYTFHSEAWQFAEVTQRIENNDAESQRLHAGCTQEWHYKRVENQYFHQSRSIVFHWFFMSKMHGYTFIEDSVPCKQVFRHDLGVTLSLPCRAQSHCK